MKKRLFTLIPLILAAMVLMGGTLLQRQQMTLADKMVASREMSAAVGHHMRRWYHKVVPAHP